MERVTHYLLLPRKNRGRKEGVCSRPHSSWEIFALRHLVISWRARVSARELCSFKKILKKSRKGMTKVCAYSSGPSGAPSRNPLGICKHSRMLAKTPSQHWWLRRASETSRRILRWRNPARKWKAHKQWWGHPESTELAHWLTGTLWRWVGITQ